MTIKLNLIQTDLIIKPSYSHKTGLFYTVWTTDRNPTLQAPRAPPLCPTEPPCTILGTVHIYEALIHTNICLLA